VIYLCNKNQQKSVHFVGSYYVEELYIYLCVYPYLQLSLLTMKTVRYCCYFLVFNFVAGFVKIRYVFAILGFILMAIVYGLKVNLSVAIVGMRNHTAEKSGPLNITHSDCPAEMRDNTTTQVSFHDGIHVSHKLLLRNTTNFYSAYRKKFLGNVCSVQPSFR